MILIISKKVGLKNYQETSIFKKKQDRMVMMAKKMITIWAAHFLYSKMKYIYKYSTFYQLKSKELGQMISNARKKGFQKGIINIIPPFLEPIITISIINIFHVLLILFELKQIIEFDQDYKYKQTFLQKQYQTMQNVIQRRCCQHDQEILAVHIGQDNKDGNKYFCPQYLIKLINSKELIFQQQILSSHLTIIIFSFNLLLILMSSDKIAFKIQKNQISKILKNNVGKNQFQQIIYKIIYLNYNVHQTNLLLKLLKKLINQKIKLKVYINNARLQLLKLKTQIKIQNYQLMQRVIYQHHKNMINSQKNK
ncbi:unnamed protein product [Paramecium primaurelia]|uniref:Transmembrane protein n=1 Tax=Paramecium primaurelia TaxID=5886 RepID=A0A8S1QSR5_PARPR|nr:unnamed protein product [Paramecium primaurelia]